MSDGIAVYIAPTESIAPIILPPDESSMVVFGKDEISVVIARPDIIAVPALGTQPPGTIVLGPDQIGTVVIGDNRVTVILSTPEITVMSDGIPGPQGPPGDGGAETANEVSYDGPYANVQEALDAILYVMPAVESFTNSVGTVEIGSTVASVMLTWAFNKTMTAVTLNGDSFDSSATSATVTGPFTSNQTWTLQASDGTNSATASTSLTFDSKRYWGVSASPSLDNAGVLSLSGSEFATNYDKAITYDATGGRYIYYAFPEMFGTPSHVSVGGLSFSDFTVTNLDLTNSSGYTEAYNVLRFGNMQTGAAIAVVFA